MSIEHGAPAVPVKKDFAAAGFNPGGFFVSGYERAISLYSPIFRPSRYQRRMSGQMVCADCPAFLANVKMATEQCSALARRLAEMSEAGLNNLRSFSRPWLCPLSLSLRMVISRSASLPLLFFGRAATPHHTPNLEHWNATRS
jgi:hypothetical protein